MPAESRVVAHPIACRNSSERESHAAGQAAARDLADYSRSTCSQSTARMHRYGAASASAPLRGRLGTLSGACAPTPIVQLHGSPSRTMSSRDPHTGSNFLSVAQLRLGLVLCSGARSSAAALSSLVMDKAAGLCLAGGPALGLPSEP